MARKKKHAEHVNHERWLVSYADFITLLFAFFVVMFAVSQVDGKKVGRFTESFSKAVGIEVFPESGNSIIYNGEGQGSDVPATPETLPADLAAFQETLGIASTAGGDALHGLQVIRRRNELVLRLPENVLFASGDDTVKELALKALDIIAAGLRDRKLEVRVEGHTDNRPIKTPRFRSNWELSTARATAVIRTLAADGIPNERLAAAGYGEFRPLAPNDTEDGRRQNRRVDLVVAVSAPLEGPASK
jgi:chemotaxis protein MotB